MAAQEQVYGFFIPSVTLMGIGAHKEVPERMRALGGKRVFLVTDKGITNAGLTKKITDLLEEAGLETVVFDETVPNPTDTNVHDGVQAYKNSDCDSLITLGGGSAHDCGKGVGLVVANGGKIHDFEGIDKSTQPMPPYLAINTTAGTASEMTRFCIITDTSRKVKMAIVDWRCTPNIAIDDPLLMVGMPPDLTAATGMDALTHAVEAYVSNVATPMTDTCALKAIELVFEALRPAVANGQDMEARDKMCYAQYLAGMAFNNASLGHVHAMAHQLGGYYDLPHGVCNAILLPHVERFNLVARVDRFVDMARVMGEKVEHLSRRDAAEQALKAIRQLSEDIGIPSGLRELGVKEEDIPTMTRNAQADACGLTNPRCPSDNQVEQIYRAAL
jgi:alcohol dehydrogenase